jgi:hypothetical protein
VKAPANISRIDEFEKSLLASGAPMVELPTTHRFTPGLYIREVTLKAGVIYTTRTHKTEHPFVISSGRVTVFHEDGSRRELRAPHTGITPVGARRVILTLEDTVWTTFHPTQETNLDKLEELLVEPRPEHQRERHCLQPDATQRTISTVS